MEMVLESIELEIEKGGLYIIDSPFKSEIIIP